MVGSVVSGSTWYVGLAATLHDPAIAIVGEDGTVAFAEALERPLQEKRAWNQPPDAMGHVGRVIEEYCGTRPRLVVATSWSRTLANRLRTAELAELPVFRPWLGRFARSLAAKRDHQVWPLSGYWPLLKSLGNSVTQAGLNLEWRGLLPTGAKILGFDHHLAHAATAAAFSEFDEAVCAVVDGFGEGTSNAFFVLREGRVQRIARTGGGRRASLGMFYATLCRLCGFDPVAGEEWKVMGLAPYGQLDPKLYDVLRPLLRVDGLELKQGVTTAEYRKRVEQLATQIRPADSPPQEAADLARTGQEIFCETMRDMLNNLYALGHSNRLMLTGGCALNSAWNGRVLAETPFTELSVPSAPADDGCAIGAAQLARLQDRPDSRLPVASCGFALGTAPRRDTLDRLLRYGLPAGIALAHGDATGRAARLIANGGIVGWMQGRAEMGPRALGQRSILADPRDPGIKDRINAEVKFRESFRPFAPAILHEFGSDWFEDYADAPYMERTFRFRERHRASLPGVVHVDGTGRAQSVHPTRSPRFHALVSAFHRLTDVPILLNTSLNRMGKPIVHAIEDALGLFLTTGMDALVIEDVMLTKENDRMKAIPTNQEPR